jgi:hypothetical protein
MTYIEDYVNRLKAIQAAELGQALERPVSKSEFANLILQRARSDFSVQNAPPSMPEEKKSLGQKFKGGALKVLDILARPSYAFSEASDVAFNDDGASIGDVVKGAGRGISGKDKTSFIDVLQNQYKDDIEDDPEYQRLKADPRYAGEAEWYKKSKESQVDTSAKAAVGGTLVDLILDPINAIGAGAITKPIRALKGVKSGAELGEAAEEISATGAKALAPEALQEAPETGLPSYSRDTLKPTEGIKSSTFADVLRSRQTSSEFPSVSDNFASSRRPPGKMVDGKWIKADYQGAKELSQPSARFADLNDVFNRDLRPDDFAKLQKARVTNETAQVVDQVSKGNPSALELLATTAEPLPPVARSHVASAVDHITKEIKNSIPDPAKAKAAGKQPRHPVFNAPTQNNLSNRLTNAARDQLIKESGGSINKAATAKLTPAVYSNYMKMLKNAEEGLITRGRTTADGSLYPRGGIKPNSPYLRLSDVLEALPRHIAIRSILGPNQKDKVLPSIILKAITGNNAALGKIARQAPDLAQAIRETDWAPLMVKEYATRTIDAANKAEKITSDVAGFINAKLMTQSSDVSKASVIDKTVAAGKKEFAKEMPEARASLKDMLDGLRKSMPNPLPDPVDDIITRGKQKLAAGVFSSGNGQKVAQKPRIDTATSVNDTVLLEDGAVTKDAATNMDLAAKSAESGIFSTVLKWVDPASGYKDLRQLVLKNIGVRRASATTRAHEVIKVFSSIPEAEHMDFWNEVRGFLPPVAHHAQAVEQMQKFIGNMFGESGLAEKFAGNTSVARAGLNIDHLNKHLRIVGVKDFKFINEVPDPLKKGTLRLSGPQILDTWKNYTPTDSKALRVFVYNLSQAVENSMVEYSTFANMGAIWGSRTAKKGFIQVDGMHSAIDGMYFPQDIVSQIGGMARGIDEMFEPLGGGKLMQVFDQGLRTWKTGVTIYAPSHHIRNMVGDVFMGWLDGVNNPMYYTKAAQVLKANHHRYSDIEVGKNPLSDILGEGRETEIISDIIGQKKTRIPKSTRVIAKAKIGNKRYPITIDQVYQMGFRHGLFPHSAVIEDLPGSETLMETLANRFHPGKAGPFQPAKGKIGNAVRGLSESREHYVRIAHYLHAIENTKASSLEDLFQKAATRVRKYHPDGLDLTKTEKQVFRRVMPFYSWNRKAIPLILEGMVMNPHKILAYPKVMGGIQESQGQESSIGDPWPDDQLFPDWLAGNVIGPVINPTDGFAKAIARSDEEVGYGLVNPGNPATDLMSEYLNNPDKAVLNSINPFIKIPAEMAFGREIQSGAPIDDKTEYIDKNVPMLSTISRLTNGAVGSGLIEGGDLKGKETQPTNIQALLNYLTGAGILDTGRYVKGGEFDLRERLAKEKENAK